MNQRYVGWSHFERVFVHDCEIQAKNQQDFAYLICGIEGRGKSNLILNCVDLIDKIKGKQTPLENIAFSIKDFAKASYQGGYRNKTLVMDEGKELEATNWQNKDVKAFKKFITKVRMAGHTYFIAFPNPVSMMGYLRDDKVSAIIICWSNKNKTKFFAGIFNREKFIEVLELFEKKNLNKSIHEVIKVGLAGKFNFWTDKIPKYEGRLLEAYKKKKDEEVDKAHEEFYKETGNTDNDESVTLVDLKKNYYNIKIASQKTGLKVETIQNYVRSGKIKADKGLNGRWRFDDDSLEEFIKERAISKSQRYGFLK